jgi:hypothetical protein
MDHDLHSLLNEVSEYAAETIRDHMKVQTCLAVDLTEDDEDEVRLVKDRGTLYRVVIHP